MMSEYSAQRVCAKCGFSLLPETRFCRGCGAPVSESFSASVETNIEAEDASESPIRRRHGRFTRYLVLTSLLSALFIAVFGAGLLTYNYMRVRQSVPMTEPPAAAPAPAAAAVSAEELLTQAKADMQAGKANEAIEKLDKATAMEGASAELFKVRGDALTSASRYSEAIESYRQAVARDGGYLDAHRSLAQSYEQLGQDDQAIESYNSALNIKNDDIELRLRFARALQRRGRVDEARKNYEQVAASSDEQLAQLARQEIARLNLKRSPSSPTKTTDNTPVAAPSLPAPATVQPPPALEPPPESPKLELPKPAPSRAEPAISAEEHISRGQKLFNQGDSGGALREYQNALKQQPNNQSVHYLIGLAHEKTENYEAALEAYSRCQSGPYAGVSRNHVEMLRKKLRKK